MKILLDTNILVRSAQPDHPQHRLARDAVKTLLEQGEELCIVPQNLYEFWSVATRSKGENGLGLTPAESATEVAQIKRFFTLFRDERAVFRHWERLVIQHEVKGKTAHDARLVAAMHRHGLNRILTFNVGDFTRFTNITVVTPGNVIQPIRPR